LCVPPPADRSSEADGKKFEEAYFLAKKEFCEMKYTSHQQSVLPAFNRIEELTREIAAICNTSPSLNYSEINFMTDLAKLAYVARRCISFTYPARYYMKG
jgi:hypothetical protein